MKQRVSRMLCLLGAGVALILLLDLGCPARHLIGIPCPGCGMTRACLAACRLDFAEAFRMNPLWPLVLILLVTAVLRGGRLFKSQKTEKRVAVLLLVLVLTVYLVRMILYFPHTAPMDFYEEALLWRFLSWW